MKKILYSFEEWCLNNNRQDLLIRWDYELNSASPSEINYKSNKKFWFKCPNNRHESQLQNIQYFASGKQKNMKCTKCDSFAQNIIDNYGEEYLSIIWNKDNVLNPWELSYKSNKKAIFNCCNNAKHIYDQSLFHYTEGVRCSFCANQKILKENSLGYSNSKVLNIWSIKNDKTPYEYAPHSSSLVWWKCENNIHPDYKRSIANSFCKDFNCPKCSFVNMGKNRRKDLTGMIFGELNVLYIDEQKTLENDGVYWFCKCACGAIKSIESSSLLYTGTTTCGDRSKHFSGSQNPNWKGGRTPQNQIARTSNKYRLWRNEIYKKDWYTCQCCGNSKKINKQAHHLYNFSNNEDLRYDVDNGILLCDKCHYSTIPGSFHYEYGTGANTPEQLEEYINIKRKSLGIDIPFSLESYQKGNVLKPNVIRRIQNGKAK